MRKIYSFFPFLILSVSAFSQINCRVVVKSEFPHNTSKVSGVTISTTDTSKKVLRLRCGAASIASGNEPLIIVDGVLIENKSIASLNPNDIESIEVLKDAAALALYGCRAYPGVIVIITKKAKSEFVVKDFLTGTSIPSATVTFTSVKNKKDTLAFIADGNGIVATDRLKAGEEYSVKVTSVGYKSYYTNYKRLNKQQEFLLERDVVLNSEVVVTNRYCPRQISCGFTVTKISHCPLLIDSVSSVRVKSTIFPNPVQRGGSFIVELSCQKEKSISITMLDAGGRQVKAQPIQTVKGINKFSINTGSRWAAGIYFIKLEDEQQRVIKKEQIVIQ